MMFKKLSKYENLFLEQESMELYQLVNGEMKPLQHDAVIGLKRNDLSMEDRFAAMDAKVASGEISCNLDNPEDCINCGS